jgi:hypothetical protein
MPVGRYFAFVGSFLFALFLAVTWNVAPPPPTQDPIPLGEKLNIRIESPAKGPEKVVIDTDIPPQSGLPPAAPTAAPATASLQRGAT